MADWVVDTLNAVHAPLTKANRQILESWQRWEGGHTANRATYNWLNTTRGSQYPSINKVGVRAYPNYQTGVQMTAQTLLGGYPSIVGALRSGQGTSILQDPGGQADLNKWLSGRQTPGASPYIRKIASTVGMQLPASAGAAATPAAGFAVSQPQQPAYEPVNPLQRTLGLLAAMQMPSPRDRTMGLLGAIMTRRQRRAAPSLPAAPDVSSGGAATGSLPPVQGAPTSLRSQGSLAELFYDPLGAYDEGKFIDPIGGHSDHVHVSMRNAQAMINAIGMAQKMGLSARENPYTDPVDPVHTTGSYHYRNFPGTYGGKNVGMGLDVSGDPARMAAFYKAILARYR